jgi:AAA+ ATPase superfamily predicted ATPase
VFGRAALVELSNIYAEKMLKHFLFEYLRFLFRWIKELGLEVYINHAIHCNPSGRIVLFY